MKLRRWEVSAVWYRPHPVANAVSGEWAVTHGRYLTRRGAERVRRRREDAMDVPQRDSFAYVVRRAW